MLPAPLIRSLVCLIIAVAVAASLREQSTGLLEGMFVQALSIVAGLAFAAAFYFLQSLSDLKRRAIAAIKLGRRQAGLERLSPTLEEHIRSEFDATAGETYKNAVATLILVVIYCGAVLWDRVDIPIVRWPRALPLSKAQSLFAIAIASFLLVFWAAIDILGAAFDASKIGALSETSESLPSTAEPCPTPSSTPTLPPTTPSR